MVLPIHTVEAPVTALAVGLVTVKVPLDAAPNAVTTATVPLVPFPIVAIICVAVFEVIVAAVPPIVTDVAPNKLLPFIVIELPTQPTELEVVNVGHKTVTRPSAPDPELAPPSPRPPPPPPGTTPFNPFTPFAPPLPPFPVPVPPAPPVLLPLAPPLLPLRLKNADPPPPPPPSLGLPLAVPPLPPANFIVPVLAAVVPPAAPVRVDVLDPPAATTDVILKLELAPAIPVAPPAPTVTE